MVKQNNAPQAQRALRPVRSSEDTFVNALLGKRVETKNGRLYVYDSITGTPTIVCLRRNSLR